MRALILLAAANADVVQTAENVYSTVDEIKAAGIVVLAFVLCFHVGRILIGRIFRS